MDWYIVITLVTGTAAICGISSMLIRRKSLRVKLGLISVVYFMYSGLGIAADSRLAQRYTIPYFLFLSALLLGVALGGEGLRRPGTRTNSRSEPAIACSPVRPRQWWSDRTATVLALTYLGAILVQVVLSAGATALLNPTDVILGTNIGGAVFEGRLARAGNALFVALGYVRLLALPFFYIELQRRLDGRWAAQLVTLFAVTYIQVTAANQWGRAAWIQPLLIWLITLLYHGRLSSIRFSATAITLSVCLIPALNAVASWRSNLGFSLTGAFDENVENFLSQEGSYPSLYPAAEAMGAAGDYTEKYLTWLLSLPIPSSLTGGSFSVTRDFSEGLLGIAYGRGGFYVALPSWLGESFIAFGENFAIWGLIVGVIIGLLDRFTAKTTKLTVFDAYLTALLVVSLRSVGQEYISQAIGCLWILMALLVVRSLGLHKTPSQQQSRSSHYARS